MFKIAMIGWATLFIAGCGGGGPMEPTTPMVVTVGGTVNLPNTFNKDSGRWECAHTLTATASDGSPGESALWVSVEIVLTDADGVFAVTISNIDVAKFWGSGRISVGQQQASERVAVSQTPLSFDLRYTFLLQMPDGEMESVATSINCIP